MSRHRPAPVRDRHLRRGVQRSPEHSVRYLGSGERSDDVVLRAEAERKSDAAQNPVQFSISTETVEVQHRQPRCLGKQLFVCHGRSPHARTSCYALSHARHNLNLHRADKNFFVVSNREISAIRIESNLVFVLSAPDETPAPENCPQPAGAGTLSSSPDAQSGETATAYQCHQPQMPSPVQFGRM